MPIAQGCVSSSVTFDMKGMKMKPLLLVITTAMFSHIAQGGIDIEDRTQTDPLLKIRTWNEGILPAVDDLFKTIDPTGAEIQRDRTPVSYKKLWGKNDVFMMHAPSMEKHGFIDFSEVTGKSKGSLKLHIKNHPYGDHHIKLKLDGEIVEDEAIYKGKWEFFKVKFDNQPVVLEIHATQWRYENCFITYRIEK
jgi:hypothetical protein